MSVRVGVIVGVGVPVGDNVGVATTVSVIVGEVVVGNGDVMSDQTAKSFAA